MALIVRDAVVRKAISTLLPDASAFYVIVPSKYLSEPYELSTGDRIRGRVLKAECGGEELPVLKDREIEFVLEVGMICDTLYVCREDWIEHFREYGLVEGGYVLELRLEKAITIAGEEVALYSKRDLVVESEREPVLA